MERERQEPTFGKPDLSDVHFRAGRRPDHSPTPPTLQIPWGPIVLGIVATVAIAMGLIEWNARRQAAAMTAELMRPISAKERAQLDAELSRMSKALDAELSKHVVAPAQYRTTERYRPVPLLPGERCIKGRRFQRIQGGWRDLPNKPC